MLDTICIFFFCRTPKLKRVVLPETGDFSREGVDKVMSLWRDLESITITSAVPGYYLLLVIGQYCINITEMKFSEGCYFEEKHAVAMTKYTPNLKRLSIRSVPTSVKALFCVLTFLDHLEKVNICHSLIMDTAYPGTKIVDVNGLRMRLPPSSAEKLLYCERGSCLRCRQPQGQRGTAPSRQPRGGPFEDVWGDDEITSLAHLPQPFRASRAGSRLARLPSFIIRRMFKKFSFGQH